MEVRVERSAISGDVGVEAKDRLLAKQLRESKAAGLRSTAYGISKLYEKLLPVIRGRWVALVVPATPGLAYAEGCEMQRFQVFRIGQQLASLLAACGTVGADGELAEHFAGDWADALEKRGKVCGTGELEVFAEVGAVEELWGKEEGYLQRY